MPARPSVAATIFKAGLVAGALDITAAIIDVYVSTGKNPVPMFTFIASGVFGKAAFAGNWSMAALGLVFHFLIALIFASIFYIAWPLIRKAIKNPVLAGLLYGVAIWAIMNHIVLPLSNAPPLSFSWLKAIKAMGIVMVCVGLPIAIITYRDFIRRGGTGPRPVFDN